MHTYFVRGHGIASGANELDAALLRLRSFEAASPPRNSRSRWLMSYALRETNGRLGLACVFAATDVQAVQEHARAVRLPTEDVVLVTSTLSACRFDSTRSYLVRRGHGRIDAAEVGRVLARAGRMADDEMAPRARWLCSYTLREADGSSGSACLYQAADPQVLIDHARRAGLPAGRTTPVLGRVVFRTEPSQRSAAIVGTTR